MNRDELVGYIQGLLDISKEVEEDIEPKLLKLINKALAKHRDNLNGEINHFNKRADEYATSSEKRDPQISNQGEFGKIQK